VSTPDVVGPTRDRGGRASRGFATLSLAYHAGFIGGALLLAASATTRAPAVVTAADDAPVVAFVSLAGPSGPAAGALPEGVATPTLPEEALAPEPPVPSAPEPPPVTMPPDVVPPDPFAMRATATPPPRRVVRMTTALTNRDPDRGSGHHGVRGGATTGAGGGPGTAGPLVPVSTVDVAPVPVHRVKPSYSDTLREARASGTVTARLLVDVDGTVKAVEIRDDFGLDSGALARAAFAQFRFRPARRDGVAVAVWIVHRIRFEFQE